MTIRLADVTKDNWQACAGLRIHPDQSHFVRDNLYSIAEAQFYPAVFIRAVYTEQGAMVGFVMYGQDDETEKWWVFRLMIDQNHQGRGYGRQTLQEIMRIITETHEPDEIWTSFHVDNAPSRNLFASFGFIEAGRKGDMLLSVWRPDTQTQK